MRGELKRIGPIWVHACRNDCIVMYLALGSRLDLAIVADIAQVHGRHAMRVDFA